MAASIPIRVAPVNAAIIGSLHAWLPLPDGIARHGRLDQNRRIASTDF